MRSLMRKAAVVAAVIVATVGVTACEATADVLVDVAPGGSGEITVTLTLDAEAAQRLGPDLNSALRFDDVAGAGWDVDGPTTGDGDDAATVVSARKSFSGPDELGAAMEELGGPDGPFANFTLEVADRFTATDYRLSGTVALSGSLDQFSDSEVAAALDGFATGRSPDELRAALAENPEALQLGLEVRLPGSPTGSAGPFGTDRGYSESFVLGTGVPQTTEPVVTSVARDVSGLLWALGGALLIVGGLVMLVRNRGRRVGPAAAPRAGRGISAEEVAEPDLQPVPVPVPVPVPTPEPEPEPKPQPAPAAAPGVVPTVVPGALPEGPPRWADAGDR